MLDDVLQDLNDYRQAKKSQPHQAMPGVPRAISLGPSDGDIISYVGTFTYKIFEAKKKDVAGISASLDRLRATELYGLRKVRSYAFSAETYRASFVRSFPIFEDGLRGHRLHFENIVSITENRHLIFAEPYWQKVVPKYDGGIAWMEFDIDVSSSGIPVAAPARTARPVAISLGSRLFLFVESYDPNRTETSNPLLMNTDDSSFSFNFDRSPSIIRKVESMIDSVVVRFTSLLIARFTSAPLNASVDYQVPGLIILDRIGKSALLDGQYEQAGYTVRVYEDGWKVKTYIRFSILTANHPSNKYYDPTPTQVQRYKNKMAELREQSERAVCSEFKGIYGQGTCMIEVKK